MADQGVAQTDEMVSEFAAVTGADEERCRFYLQSAHWDLNVALETFYDQSGDGDEPVEVDPQDAPDTVSAQPPAQPTAGRTKPNSNIFSLSSLRGQEDDQSSDGEEGQAFYAGGSEHSGQQILGPDKTKKKNPTGDLFEAAKKHGASAVTEEDTPSAAKKTYFKGAGYKLGSDVEPSQQVAPSLSKDDMVSGTPQTVIVKFWKNGFSIDDGPLRDFNDPANKNFLDSISKGEVPAELRSHVRNSEVHVNMEDHREEEYVKPKSRLAAFSGKGQMLGSPTPNIVQQPSSEAVPPTSAPQNPTFQVDESQPLTTIQIRLADGTRLVSKFNHTSTVGDIRNVVRSARPNTGNFNLMTTFPNKVLSEDLVTISDAKLLNAVIVQRMT